jgi:hypothetical protein
MLLAYQSVIPKCQIDRPILAFRLCWKCITHNGRNSLDLCRRDRCYPRARMEKEAARFSTGCKFDRGETCKKHQVAPCVPIRNHEISKYKVHIGIPARQNCIMYNRCNLSYRDRATHATSYLPIWLRVQSQGPAILPHVDLWRTFRTILRLFSEPR